MESEHEWGVAASYDAVYKAEMAVTQLQAAEIPARLDRKGAVGLFGPSFQGTTVRGVDVLVPASAVNEARRLLDVEPAE